jgi:hypothetical protein
LRFWNPTGNFAINLFLSQKRFHDLSHHVSVVKAVEMIAAESGVDNFHQLKPGTDESGMSEMMRDKEYLYNP